MQAACDFCLACARSLIRFYTDNDVNLSPERNTMPSKTTFTRPISGQVTLFPNNEAWMIF